MSQFDFKHGLRQEWFETDGRGTLACSTAAGPNTRRGHGLMIREDASGIRWVLVNHFEEWVEISGKRFPLSSTIYFDGAAEGQITIYPRGYVHLTSFTSSPFPRWTYLVEGHRIIRTIRPVQDQEGLLLEYSLIPSNGGQAVLFLRPMLSGRKTADLHLENKTIRTGPAERDGRLVFKPYDGVPKLVMHYSETAAFHEHALWYRRVRLLSESRDEDAWLSPGEFVMPLSPDRPSWIRISTDDRTGKNHQAPSLFASEIPADPAASVRRSIRIRTMTDGADRARFMTDRLSKDCPLEEVVWSLLLIADDLDPEILSALLRGYADEIPNAPLDLRLAWVGVIADAVQRGIALKEMAAAALSTIETMLSRAVDGAEVAPTLLLKVTKPGQTWWERHDDRKASRAGFPVEIQALWINALAAAEILEQSLERKSDGRFGKAFLQAVDMVKRRYWHAEESYLHESLPDEESRLPERMSSAALVAAAMRCDILSPSRARAVLGTARRAFVLSTEAPVAVDPDGRTSVWGLRAFADSARSFPWLIGLWQRARSRQDGDAIPELEIDDLSHLCSTPNEFSLPHSVRLMEPDHRAPAGSMRIEISRPSVLSLAGFIAAIKTEG